MTLRPLGSSDTEIQVNGETEHVEEQNDHTTYDVSINTNSFFDNYSSESINLDNIGRYEWVEFNNAYYYDISITITHEASGDSSNEVFVRNSNDVNIISYDLNHGESKTWNFHGAHDIKDCSVRSGSTSSNVTFEVSGYSSTGSEISSISINSTPME